jgi:hypothetical protein
MMWGKVKTVLLFLGNSLIAIVQLSVPPKKPKKAVYSLQIFTNEVKGKKVKEKEVTNMSTTISAAAKRTFTAVLKDNGVAVSPVGVPVWTVSPEGGVSLFPSADGLSVDVLNLAAGSQTLTVTADPGSGVAPLSASVDIQTLAAPPPPPPPPPTHSFTLDIAVGDEVPA